MFKKAITFATTVIDSLVKETLLSDFQASYAHPASYPALTIGYYHYLGRVKNADMKSKSSCLRDVTKGAWGL